MTLDYLIGLSQAISINPSKIQSLDSTGLTPLHWAVQRENLADARLLIEHGAYIDARDPYHETPLHYAAKSGNVEIVRALLISKCAVDSPNADDMTPLHYACKSNASESTKVVDILLQHGAVPDNRNAIGRTVLNSLVRINHLRPVTSVEAKIMLLVRAGASLNLADCEGLTPLGHASRTSSDGTVFRILYDLGAEIDLSCLRVMPSSNRPVRVGNSDLYKWLYQMTLQGNRGVMQTWPGDNARCNIRAHERYWDNFESGWSSL